MEFEEIFDFRLKFSMFLFKNLSQQKFEEIYKFRQKY